MRLSVVIPFYNEEASVRPLFARLWPVLEELKAEIEIICIDDGSHDATSRRLLAQRATDARVHVIALSRNFGKEAALTAGLDHATGDAIVFMDGARVEATMQGNNKNNGYLSLDFVSPEAIDRIEVVRGPMASARYGPEARGGVILIFTKGGGH